jgi:ornithine carbamoyltransferase
MGRQWSLQTTHLRLSKVQTSSSLTLGMTSQSQAYGCRISMGQEAEKAQRLKDFAGYQVTNKMVAKGGAKKD